MKIEQVGTGARYDEAIDPENSGRTYIETDEPIDPPEPVDHDNSLSELEQAAQILFGEAE